MRVPLGVAVLTCAAVASLLVGCGGDEETPLETGTASATALAPTERPTAAPTATTTLTAESDGEAGFREFANKIEASLGDGDGSFFANRAVEQDLVCAGDEQVGICSGVPAGTAFRGIPQGIFQTDAFDLLSPDQYEADLADWFGNAHPELEDVYGDGTVALYAVAYKAAGGGAEEAYQAIITAIVTSDPESLRQARSLSFRFVDGRWRLTGEIAANLPQTAEAWLSGGCDYCYDRWELWEGS